MKFGGTSVANVARIRAAAEKILDLQKRYQKMVVVVSAMAGVTNTLVGYCQEISQEVASDDTDMVLTTGEQVSTGLMSLMLQSLGARVKALMSWQIPIITTDVPGNARIKQVADEVLQTHFRTVDILVVPGFQGVNREGRLRTLGRGGSDTSAVAIAGALGVECSIYTDVSGIYSADPREVNDAAHLPFISFEQALALAKNGAKVMHYKAVEEGMKSGTPIRVLSTFEEGEGTLISETPAVSKGPYMGLSLERVVVIHVPATINKKLPDIQAHFQAEDVLYFYLQKQERHYISVNRSEYKRVMNHLEKHYNDFLEGGAFALNSLLKITFVKGAEGPVVVPKGLDIWAQEEEKHAVHFWVSTQQEESSLMSALHEELVK